MNPNVRKNKQLPASKAAQLRTRAEAQAWGPTRNSRPNAWDTQSAVDSHRLVQELQVHQVELEMQNAELQEAHAQSEALIEKYTELYDFAPVGYFTLATDGVILQVNLTGTRLVGIERSRLIGQSFRLLVSSECRLTFNAFLKQVFADQSKQSSDFVLLIKGEITQFVNIEAQRSPDGRECRAIVADVSERKQAEGILRQNETLFAKLIEQAPIGVYVVDSELRMRQVNPNAEPAFGKIHPLNGRKLSEVTHLIWPKRIADKLLEHFERTLETGKPYHSPEFRERRKDIGLIESYDWQLQRVMLPSGDHGVVCFFTNVTARKQLEASQRRIEVLAASNKKLEQEIAHRLTVEGALERSEGHQRRLLKRSRQMQSQLRLLSHRILQAQEEERKRISRELHDVIVQTLTGINIRLAALKKEATRSTKGLDRNIARTQRLVEASVHIVHEFARNLRPTALDDLGLIPALHSFMIAFSAESGVRTRLTAFAGVEKVNAAKRTVLFRVAQEALTNVARHARASRAAVTIQKVTNGICMKISDDGKCLEVDQAMQAQNANRLGLLGMRERLEMVGGSLKVECTAGKGTTIITRIPIGKSRKGAPASLAT